MVRRSLTFENDIDAAIQHYRAASLSKGVDINYTEAVNELLRIVLKKQLEADIRNG